MKPINTQDRRKQFLIFLGMIIVTLTICLISFSFNFINPEKQLQTLKSDNKILNEKIAYGEDYLKQMNAFKDSLKKAMLLPGYSRSSTLRNISESMLPSLDRVDSTIRMQGLDYVYLYKNYSLEMITQIDSLKTGLEYLNKKYSDLLSEYTKLKTERDDLKTQNNALSVQKK